MPPRKRLRAVTSVPASAPVVSVKPDRLAWRKALSLAGGDVKRLVVLDDGAVLVTRRP